MLRMNRVDQSRACALNPLALYFYNNVVYVETTHTVVARNIHTHTHALTHLVMKTFGTIFFILLV